MRGAEVRKVLENVGVRFQAAGRAFALGQEREAVIDHVVSEDAAIGILRRLRRIEIQHVGQCSLLVDLGNRFFARVISCVAHQMHELIEPALSIVHRLTGVVAIRYFYDLLKSFVHLVAGPVALPVIECSVGLFCGLGLLFVAGHVLPHSSRTRPEARTIR